jgi:hypothetical protein
MEPTACWGLDLGLSLHTLRSLRTLEDLPTTSLCFMTLEKVPYDSSSAAPQPGEWYRPFALAKP